MECDFCFEDSVFLETRERTGQTGLSYTAKRCEPQWFSGDVNNGDSDDVHTRSKFRADFSYRQEDFEKAFTEYSDCCALLPPANHVMRRDVQESQARCLIHLGRHKEAWEIAELLTKGVSNTDHLSGVLHLQATIHKHLGNLQEEVSCWQQLISLHPFNPQFWICLAESYTSLSLAVSSCKDPSRSTNGFSLFSQRSQPCNNDIARTIDSVVSREKSVLGPCDESDASSWTVYRDGDQLWLWSCASYIRARLLLQFIQPQHASFVLENNLETQRKIEEQLDKRGLLEEHKMLMVEVMGEDLIAERTKEEGQTDTKTTQSLSSYKTPSDAEFKVRWFQKMNALFKASE